jgi:2-polyprenyl-3-methyl-5-hydroxy-6-metoxy-1,4-benzoquinol methylase
MLYVGDLSAQDAQVLAHLSRSSLKILEFGCGGSTQILAQSAAVLADITSVETDSTWIERTESLLAVLGRPGRVQFLPWDQWKATLGPPTPEYDFIFNDGVDHLRLEFARDAWNYLKIGGILAFHDTKRPTDATLAFQFCTEKFLEIDTIRVNHLGSNITFVEKRVALRYYDWNVAEQRPPWMSAMAPVEESIERLRETRLAPVRSPA